MEDMAVDKPATVANESPNEGMEILMRDLTMEDKEDWGNQEKGQPQAEYRKGEASEVILQKKQEENR
ncbi:hypothetical protein L6452_04257 [Arctium lappa]|uniref:Uncharacterized protein n=1 Tax=Arctium lappa TaxID=4217 RepID=A0ACB9FPK0_ARCLA|nr:hypothetical protein L6452_04257 [Arctium lappa]